MEPGVFHFLNQILRRISVIAYFQRLYFINLYQIEKPLENVVIIDRIFPAYRQESLFPENIIGDALFVDRDLITLLRHKELHQTIIHAAALYDDARRRQVRCARQIDPADAVTSPEVVKRQVNRNPGFVFPCRFFHVLKI